MRTVLQVCEPGVGEVCVQRHDWGRAFLSTVYTAHPRSAPSDASLPTVGRASHRAAPGPHRARRCPRRPRPRSRRRGLAAGRARAPIPLTSPVSANATPSGKRGLKRPKGGDRVRRGRVPDAQTSAAMRGRPQKARKQRRARPTPAESAKNGGARTDARRKASSTAPKAAESAKNRGRKRDGAAHRL